MALVTYLNAHLSLSSGDPLLVTSMAFRNSMKSMQPFPSRSNVLRDIKERSSYWRAKGLLWPFFDIYSDQSYCYQVNLRTFPCKLLFRREKQLSNDQCKSMFCYMITRWYGMARIHYNVDPIRHRFKVYSECIVVVCHKSKLLLNFLGEIS